MHNDGAVTILYEAREDAFLKAFWYCKLSIKYPGFGMNVAEFALSDDLDVNIKIKPISQYNTFAYGLDGA